MVAVASVPFPSASNTQRVASDNTEDSLPTSRTIRRLAVRAVSAACPDRACCVVVLVVGVVVAVASFSSFSFVLVLPK